MEEQWEEFVEYMKSDLVEHEKDFWRDAYSDDDLLVLFLEFTGAGND